MPVAHACNLNYSGGRDQEDHVLRSTQASKKKKSQKRAGGVVQGVGPEFKLQSAKKKKGKKEKVIYTG
jgi:hypothetical protein